MTRTLTYYIFPLTLRFVVVVVFAISVLPAVAQTKDTATYTSLDVVVIVPLKQSILQPSKKTLQLDSTILARSASSSVAELLADQSTVYIKSYGGGNIATTSFRGGNANHTALLWNGLNIQNAMLGQTDLSIIPVLFFDNLSLEYGGGSALWGSGAIGGSIKLNNKLLFDQGYHTKLQMSLGSFDTKKIAASVLLSYKRIASSTRVYYTLSTNNYNYKDTTDKENPYKTMPHADYVMKGLMQEISFLATSRQIINLRFWYNKANRNLPSYTSDISKRSQEDENLKLNADWNYRHRRINSTVRLAYFNDKLNYTDSMSRIFSKSTVSTIIAESDNIYKYGNHAFNLGANYTQYNSKLPIEVDATANSGSVSLIRDSIIRHHQIKLALFAVYRISLLNTRFNYDIAIRKEFTDQTIIPFTGNTGIQYQLWKWLGAKINASKSYRQPTLNDLYWPQGGNPNLKPEEGYEAEGSLTAKVSKNRFSILIEGTYFNRHTTNWIIWLPTAYSYFSPRNIAKVYSRGTESRTELSYTKKDLFIKLGLNTSYVLSTNEAGTNENDNAIDRQLIYTPRYSGQSSLTCIYKDITLLFSQSYTGYRFTSTDNTSWLNPYYLANVKLAYKYSFNSVMVEFFAGINNIFDKNYVAVANRPMPLRNYEAGLSLHYIKKNTKS